MTEIHQNVYDIEQWHPCKGYDNIFNLQMYHYDSIESTRTQHSLEVNYPVVPSFRRDVIQQTYRSVVYLCGPEIHDHR